MTDRLPAREQMPMHTKTRTLQDMTDRLPASEQMPTYTKMLEVPCVGATLNISHRMMMTAVHT
jgi:hypothetical protein